MTNHRLKRKSSHYSGAFLCVLTVFLLSSSARSQEAPKPNILFICIDDMNHWVGHLGTHPQSKTPNIDRLAGSGVAFSRAYCAAPACNPSRIALMSGMRPSTTGCYDNSQDWKPVVSVDKLLNTTLSRAGYSVTGAGKIYHGGLGMPEIWDETFTMSGGGKMVRHPTAKDDGVGGIKFSPLSNTDEDMPDYKVASFGIEQLQKKHQKPFFLAIGIVKPHLPFSVPKKWFDMFPLDSIELPPHQAGDLEDVPEAGVRMAKPKGDHAEILRSGRWKEAVQAYLASIAFADAQIGRLLDALDKSEYRDNTIVCLWSDHGWSLGEKEHWRKFALWEEPTRSVFVWKVPGITPVGMRCTRPVDLMCIYPTICSLTGIAKPSHVEGLDISPLLKDPSKSSDWSALTTFHRNNHSYRSEKWRYIRYADGSEELYDHEADPNEWHNLAQDPKHVEVKQQFLTQGPKINAPELPTGKSSD